ncbi:MAG: hypothetical protein CYPHOPRED_001252 [Cyphobasidiales sp. Tagirdzhanova-0007]|nr:MAG: hypothetical protein CYPHOPRED_001252 [Cyphobasidiales sp. Tagirdzhanova-0007]
MGFPHSTLPQQSPSASPTSTLRTPTASCARQIRRILLSAAILSLLFFSYASAWSNGDFSAMKDGPVKEARGGSRRSLRSWGAGLAKLDNAYSFFRPSQSLQYPSPSPPPSPPPSSSNASSITPTCRRTLLYRFAGSHGFASEYLIFLRIALLAKRYNYALFTDDSKWNYGRWNDYFLSIENTCTAPRDLHTLSRTQIAPHARDPPLSKLSSSSPPFWTGASHVVWNARKLTYLDDLFLALYVNERDLQRMHDVDIMQQKPLARPLDPVNTVPAVFETAFGHMSQEALRLWKINADMHGLVQKAEQNMSWTPEVDKRIVIAAHVRLGDKSIELANYGPHKFSRPPSTLRKLYNAWRKHYNAWRKRYNKAKLLLSSSDSTRTSLEPAKKRHPAQIDDEPVISDESVDAYMAACVAAAENAGASLFSAAASLSEERLDAGPHKPLLVLMSDDSTGKGLEKFLKHIHAKKFEVVPGIPPDAESTTLPIDSAPNDPEAPLIPLPLTNPKIKKPGFSETTFNSLSAASRISLTRTFLRDLTILSRRADGLVFTGSSNVGRLMSLLAGFEKMQRGSLRSTDVRWFPTVRYQ